MSTAGCIRKKRGFEKMGGSGWFTYFVLLIAIFYFMLYRPQQKQRKQRQELIASLELGKKVVTIGGIHGEIKNIGDETVTLEIAEGVEVDFQKSAVAFLKKDPDLTDDDDSEDVDNEDTDNDDTGNEDNNAGES